MSTFSAVVHVSDPEGKCESGSLTRWLLEGFVCRVSNYRICQYPSGSTALMHGAASGVPQIISIYYLQ
jgi:hypothetical protein